MKKFLVFLCIFLGTTAILESLYIYKNTKQKIIKPLAAPKPLLIYTFENLKKDTFPASQIRLGKKVEEANNYFSQMFYYSASTNPSSNTLKNVSGLINLPSNPGVYPVIVMIRGFVPEDIYKPGVGTEPVAKVLAQNGFITLAPDFLGFGQSASGSADSFENRFQTYTTALSLLSSISTLNSALAASYSAQYSADLSKIGIWGHSNGGHIALSTLAISGVKYPTVLWAPVSTSFPYSILYYTDESDDQGKILRKVLAQFEDLYNTDLFSPLNYYKWINAPIDIEQGTADEEVPYWWSDNLVSSLKKYGISIEYNKHVGADHNMLPASTWSDAVSNTVSFFRDQFK